MDYKREFSPQEATAAKRMLIWYARNVECLDDGMTRSLLWWAGFIWISMVDFSNRYRSEIKFRENVNEWASWL